MKVHARDQSYALPRLEDALLTAFDCTHPPPDAPCAWGTLLLGTAGPSVPVATLFGLFSLVTFLPTQEDLRT
ncbi:hypothetical protein GOODEAATRI_031482 [Goodea atripinnis]|uniref:Uncharacterized protein n=1 Tax=Goodea atripinnis TaxID=208336 RepID=A0ABV0MWQ1_9TELE